MEQYLEVLRDIYQSGSDSENRTGIKTRKKFGYQMRFNMTEGFPAVTTKRLAFKQKEVIQDIDMGDLEDAIIKLRKAEEEIIKTKNTSGIQAVTEAIGKLLNGFTATTKLDVERLITILRVHNADPKGNK